MDDNISRLLNLVPPSSLIGRYITLKQLHNKSFVGICPFHSEKTPSFKVNDEKKLFYCFGCNKGGDIFNFLQDYKNLTFSEALHEIANMYGIKIESTSLPKEDNKELKEILEEATFLFSKQIFLDKNRESLLYLENNRKISQKIIKEFRLGYCPSDNDFLVINFPDKIVQLLKIGLLSKRQDGTLYCPFQDRIIFPIFDSAGTIIGFAGRTFLPNKDKFAKYLNSKESDIFKKNRILYNYHKVKKSSFTPIFVEGYLDVITCAQFGFDSAVAGMGTALSAETLKTLLSLKNSLLFCYDSDKAGKIAEKRAIETALPLLSPAINIAFIQMENAKDIDEFLHKFGAEEMNNIIEKALPLHEKLFQICSENLSDINNPQAISLVEEKLMNLTNLISHSILRKNFQNYFRNKLYTVKFPYKTSRKKFADASLKVQQKSVLSRDAILFLFFLQNSSFLENEIRLEKFIPFIDLGLEKKLISYIKTPFEDEIINDIQKNFSIPYFSDLENQKEFYMKIYKQYICDNISLDIKNALSHKEFERARNLKEELEKLKKT